MEAEIIVIGDEILVGDTVDSNSSWLAGKLDSIGIRTLQISTIGDNEAQMLDTLHTAMKRADILVLTGGLGPTHDDITKPTLCKFFNDKLVFNQDVLDDIGGLMEKFGKKVNELNRQQAMIPETCSVIRNGRGTAPGMMFKRDDKTVISLPGVPHEMRNMMRDSVLEELSQLAVDNQRAHRYIRTFGIAEADLATRLKPHTEALPPYIKLAYLPSPGHVKLRFTVDGKVNDAILEELEIWQSTYIKEIVDYYYGGERDTLESVIGGQLLKNEMTLSTAESCTGGSLASLITSVPGSSAYFLGTVVSYANDVKTKVLGVDEAIITKFGAVSEEVVSAMAKGVRNLIGSDYALSTSGIAGPDGGTAEKPVGTIWIALAGNERVLTKKLQLGFDRKTNVRLTADHALNLLRKELKERFD